MNFFYLKHHYLSIVRSKSFTGEIIAFLLLGLMSASLTPFLFSELDSYASELASYLQTTERSFETFVVVYFMLDLLARIVLKRPQPKSHYYLFLLRSTKSISWQYLITSLFGIVPFMLLIPQLAVIVKTNVWLGSNYAWVLLGLFVANHYLGLALQFAGKKVKGVFLGITLSFSALAAGKIIPLDWVLDILLNPSTVLVIIVGATVAAFYAVDFKLKKREFFGERRGFSLFEFLPTFSFKNPLFQLEWALIIRNKRTRSNLLMGLMGVIIFPFLMDQDSPQMMVLFLTLFCTSFFIIQHGVYSLGWEGSYFDFLVTNVSLKGFIKSRYLFYLSTCVIGLLLFLIPTLITGQDVVLLICMFLYNVGVTIPLVLYRSGFNSQKIELSENSFMNYSGMMTGPILVTSFLVMLLPFFVFGIGQVILGDHAAYALAAAGVAGIVSRPFLLNKIVAFLSRKKYHLSQSFKS